MDHSKNYYSPDEIRAGLEDSVARANLPPLRLLIGSRYIFTASFGTHQVAQAGTILAVDYSDEGGLQLIVSAREFYGKRLRSLMYMEGQDGWDWAAFHEESADLKKQIDNLPDDASDSKVDRLTDELIRSRFTYGLFTLAPP